ncbi:hypothetical protein BU17DRAFT_64002 [Hysterangium stoloniferum]|nr:hypothetical protein BU17DRAFT_64002 [Hysterangium stoloniferum]
MSNRSPDTQQSLSSQKSPAQLSTKKLLHTNTRGTSLEDEKRQDHEVLEKPFITFILQGIQSGALKFELEFAVFLLSQIAEMANPPLLAALNYRDYVHKCITENEELFNLFGECLQKESFSEIWSLEMLQPDHSKPPHTPIREGKVVAKEKETKAMMATTIKDFENYIEYLAVWKLDGYLDSTRREDKVTDLEVNLPLDPILLLHNLGNHPDKTLNPNLPLSSHLFSISGSGKTCLALEGLCLNWGLYILCKSTRGPGSGSKDLEVATEEILPTLSSWDTGEFDSKNARATERIFAMLLCHVSLTAMVLRALQPADTQIMHGIIASTLKELTTMREDIFSDTSNPPLFVVIDKAQVAADNLKGYFRSNTGPDMHSILRDMYRFFLSTTIFTGFILSGTGLSIKMVKDAVGSVSAKDVPGGGSQVFTDIGICWYLTLSDNHSDCQLLECIVYWFSGHHCLTASLIELFICLENVPRRRVLTSFAERLTGFKVTDTIKLEDDEPPISPELSKLILDYRPISELDHALNENNREELIQCLVEILMRWTLGSEPTIIAIKTHLHDIICYPVSWKTGNSDRLGLKANSPEDVLAFLHDPDGKPFLLPGNHIGPDVLCTLQDKETKELIILAVQAKVSPTLNAQKWRDGINSVMPKFFYTVQKGGTRDRYAQVSYPKLVNDLTRSLKMVLGSAVYTPIANIYHSKLRSSIRAQQQSTSHSMRQTPRFLCIIATPDDEQQKHLKKEWKGHVAVLRWDV